MSKVLTINRAGWGGFNKGNVRETKRNAGSNCSVLSMKKCSKRDNMDSSLKNENTCFGFRGAFLVFFFTVIIFGSSYLYYVNELATKGQEIKEMENKIATLREINEKKKIYEVELRSMYNIEKEMQDLNLISATNIVYLDVNGTVAMK